MYTVKLHKRGSLLQTAGHPFPGLLLGQPSSALLSTAQAGGPPPSVKIGWATKTIIFEDAVRGHKMTSLFTCKFFGQFAVLGIFCQPMFISENYSKFTSEDRGYKIAKVDSCKLTVVRAVLVSQ